MCLIFPLEAGKNNNNTEDSINNPAEDLLKVIQNVLQTKIPHYDDTDCFAR